MMRNRIAPLVLLLALCLLFSGCSNRQVRHLASDASLVKAGESSRREVLLYLGEPDVVRTVAPGTEEMVYHADRTGLLGRAPLFGGSLDEAAYETVIITLQGDLVTNCEFRSYNADEDDWSEDVEWEEVK